VIAELAADEQLRRREFPICARKIYCAHATDAPLPRVVAEAMHESIQRNSIDGRDYEGELTRIEETRTAVAKLLGAEPGEIAFTGPTASGLNTVANGVDWKAGDEVVCYLDDYPANVYPWLALERFGVKPVLLEPAQIGEITPEVVERALTSRTRLVAISSANNCSGYRTDLEAIGAVCAERDVLFSVDAIQTMGAFPVPLRYVDFVSAGAQKWMLGPSGAGIMFVKKSRRQLLRPAIVGGWNVVSPNFIAQREIRFEGGGRKFEPGAYTHTVLAGLGAAVELLLKAGPANISARIQELTRLLRDRLGPAGFEFLTPSDDKLRAGILTFRHCSVDSATVLDELARKDIVVSVRHDRIGRKWLRVSPHFYNTEAEIEKIAEAVITTCSEGALAP
jgi:selenocysteine lyase/cysteine desulfurase